MKKLNITKERFEKSRYFQRKYGKLTYVSESGRLFKTNKGKVLMFKESSTDKFDELRAKLQKIIEENSWEPSDMWEYEDDNNYLYELANTVLDEKPLYLEDIVHIVDLILDRMYENNGN